MARPRPGPRALKPNQQERTHRRTTIDTLLGRALRGALTIPEAALLADCVRAEQRQADATRQSLTDTTRALDRHRAGSSPNGRRLTPDTKRPADLYPYSRRA